MFQKYTIGKDIVLMKLFFFIAAGVKCHVVAAKMFLVLHHIADFIYISFGIIEPCMIVSKSSIALHWREGKRVWRQVYAFAVKFTALVKLKLRFFILN